MSYFIVIEEWTFPTESGREPSRYTFDTLAEALVECLRLAEEALPDFFNNGVGEEGDVLPPEMYNDGYIVTTKAGLDPYYYYARAVRVDTLTDEDIALSQRKETK